MEMLALTTLGAPATRNRESVLSVEGFGKINQASIGLAPFTIICGKNNSGKSYLASLLWAVHNMDFQIFRARSGNFRAPKWFSDLLREAEQSPGTYFRVDKRKVNLHINRWLAVNGKKIVRRLLNHEAASIGTFKMHLRDDLFLRKGGEGPEEITSVDWTLDAWTLAWSDDPSTERSGWMATTAADGSKNDNLIYMEVVERIIFGKSFNGAQYIPASRSGLVLSLRFIADYLLSTLIEEDARRTASFSAPVVSFLRSLVRPSGAANDKAAKIADFLETSVLNGRVERDVEGGRPEFSYRPANSKAKLPLHASSSMVTELTPVIEQLRHAHAGQALILEEPEAHLHLSAQRQMARALVRLVNEGVPVVVTTHSDTFIQQINFLLLLSKNKQRSKLAKALGYNKSEFLKEEDVLAYEIIPEGSSCSVAQLEVTEYGLAPKTISDVVLNLSHEILEVS